MLRHPEVCYEIFVRSFCDSNGDGIGDLSGITSRLDYLSELGVRGIWLTPVQPSPSYHKYDVTDYYGIDPEYGTLEDYRNLVKEAHSRGIHVYMDLVIHHTSIFHRWFLNARGNPLSEYRQYYRWMSETQISKMGLEVRELTQDAHTVNPWHSVKGDKERFLGVFSHDMADLNFDNAELRREIYDVIDFWLNEVGVDGFRLDAARHIYPDWEDERNPVFWEEFRRRVEEIRPGTFLIGEVWAHTQHVAPFFKGLTANFNFDLCQKIEQLLVVGEQYGFVSWLQFQRGVFRQVSEGYVDAIMLSNHDQQRIGSTLRGNTDKLKLAAAILLTLPGQPYLYYGEELGMLGRKPDPFLREPFLWGEDACETTWKAARYSKAGKVKSLKEALEDPDSLYYCYKSLIRLRNTHAALGAVSHNGFADAFVVNPNLLAYIRLDGKEAFLVVHNLGKTAQILTLSDKQRDFKVICYATTRQFSLEKFRLKIGAYNSVVLEWSSKEGSYEWQES